jgi:micrococcal nuclease
MRRILAIGLALSLAFSSWALAGSPTACPNPPKPLTLAKSKVVKVVDGDTIDVRSLDGPRVRIRLLGIDTPEVHESEKLHRDIRSSGRSKETIQALGRLAWNFTRKQLDGKDLGLEFDVQRHDRFGRTLAYVWLTDGRLFNLLILREGYAQVLTIPPNIRYASLFVACQREARENRRGLWGP